MTPSFLRTCSSERDNPSPDPNPYGEVLETAPQEDHSRPSAMTLLRPQRCSSPPPQGLEPPGKRENNLSSASDYLFPQPTSGHSSSAIGKAMINIQAGYLNLLLYVLKASSRDSRK